MGAKIRRIIGDGTRRPGKRPIDERNRRRTAVDSRPSWKRANGASTATPAASAAAEAPQHALAAPPAAAQQGYEERKRTVGRLGLALEESRHAWTEIQRFRSSRT